MDPIRIVVQSESRPNQTEHLVENPEIVIHNSSFGSLDLNPGSKAQIIDCYIDAQFEPRPTLITANNSDVSIQNCHFGNFINEKSYTVLYGHYYSHVTIENSVFVQHNSSKGVLFLQKNCYMFINNSTHSHNMASSPSYSPVSLEDGIHAVMINTVFSNNSAVSGGALIAKNQCKIALTNCTFSSNKAITGKTFNISKNSNIQRSVDTPEQNTTRTVTPVSHTSFNQASFDDKKPKAIAAQLLVRNPIFEKNSVQQEDALVGTFLGFGGAIYVDTQSQLLVTNSTFKDNSAQLVGGAISVDSNVTLHVQETTFVGNKAYGAGAIGAGLNTTLHIEETTFAGNKASGDGGAIIIQQQSYLQMTNCVLEDNTSPQLGGGIGAGYNATLDIQETNFTHNSAALQGGAIDVSHQSYLHITDCTFDVNQGRHGGAISVGLNATLEIQKTNFTHNRAARQGGAIDVGQQPYLHITDCIFEDNRVEQVGGAISAGVQAVLEINGSYFSNSSASQGGAINAQYQTNLSLTNCRLERNFASDHGGAIVASINVILRIRETNFTGNSASSHAGALSAQTLIDCHVVRCVFHCNTAGSKGGAVLINLHSSLQVENTSFIYNNATDGGAIVIHSESNLQTNMCSFQKNFGKRAGGAIILYDNSATIIESCLFLSNHAITGGAVDINDPKHVSVLSTVLLRNVASDEGGAISISNGANIIINNINCVGNEGPNGGGCLSIQYVTFTLNNSDIRENFANNFGGGVDARHSRIQVCVNFTDETIYLGY